MRVAEKAEVITLYKCRGTKGYSAMKSGLNKDIIIGLIRMRRQADGIVLLDAHIRYDIMQKVVILLVLKCLEVPMKSIITILVASHQTLFCVNTYFGYESTTFKVIVTNHFKADTRSMGQRRVNVSQFWYFSRRQCTKEEGERLLHHIETHCSLSSGHKEKYINCLQGFKSAESYKNNIQKSWKHAYIHRDILLKEKQLQLNTAYSHKEGHTDRDNYLDYLTRLQKINCTSDRLSQS